mgnify:CR=1 FL=1
MNRTFQQRISAVTLLLPILLILTTVRVLWEPRLSHFIVGLLLVCVIVMILERMLHTVYVFEGNTLIIRRGRFQKQQVMEIDDIVDAKSVRHRFMPVRYILIEDSHGKMYGVQPVNEDGFLKEIERRRNNEI